MIQKKISVIIPVYNTGMYLEKCIASICDSTYQNLEIICINDGSKDNSLEILQKIAKSDDRIIVRTQENCGICKARNFGLEAASGEYICFIDSDDWIHPDYFSLLVQALEDTSADICIGNYVRTADGNYCFPELKAEEKKPRPYGFDKFFHQPRGKYYMWGKIYRKGIIEGIFFDERANGVEDVIYNANVLFKHPDIKISAIEAPIYVYRDSPTSAVHTISFERKKKCMDVLYELVEGIGKTSPFHDSYLQEIVKQALAFRYKYSFLGDKGKVTKESNELIRKSLNTMRQRFTLNYIALKLFFYYPQGYRYWRICKDPSLKVWEANVKACKTSKHSF